MSPFAKLYFDEDVSVVLAKVLSGRGFDVLTARDADMLRKTDEEQLVFGTKQGRVIVTHNRRHFEKLHSDFVQHNWSIPESSSPAAAMFTKLPEELPSY